MPLSESSFSFLAVGLLALMDWRASLLLTGVLVIVVMTPFLAWLAGGEPKAKPTTPHDEPSLGLGAVMREGRFYVLVFYVISSATLLTGLVFNQTRFIDERGWSLTILAWGFTSFAVMRVFATLFVGPLIDKWRARVVLPYSGVPFFLACAFMLIWQDNVVVGGFNVSPYIYMSLMGCYAAMLTASSTAVLPELYGIKRLGAIRSVVASMTTLGSALGVLGAGVVLDYGFGMEGILWVCLAYMTVAQVLVVRALR